MNHAHFGAAVPLTEAGGVEQRVDKKAWSQKFAADDPNESEFFEVFAWPGVLDAVHAKLWPR